MPALHRPEQQLVPPPSPVPQGLPAVAQAAFSGWQVPPLQLPLQQEPELEQLWLSATQLDAVEQIPFVVSHWRLQQSVATAHELPGPEQVATDGLHIPVTGSHAFEQHCAFEVHAAPVVLHTTLAPPVPGVPPCPPAPPAFEPLPQPPAVTARTKGTTRDPRIAFALSELIWRGSHEAGETARGMTSSPLPDHTLSDVDETAHGLRRADALVEHDPVVRLDPSS